MGHSTGKAGLRGSHQECEEAVPRKKRIATKKVNVGLRGICGRPRVRLPRRSTSPRSPSPPPRTTGRRTPRSTRCQSRPPCTSPGPVSSVAAAAPRSRTGRNCHEMVLRSAAKKPTDVSSKPRPSAAGSHHHGSTASRQSKEKAPRQINSDKIIVNLCNFV